MNDFESRLAEGMRQIADNTTNGTDRSIPGAVLRRSNRRLHITRGTEIVASIGAVLLIAGISLSVVRPLVAGPIRFPEGMEPRWLKDDADLDHEVVGEGEDPVLGSWECALIEEGQLTFECAWERPIAVPEGTRGIGSTPRSFTTIWLDEGVLRGPFPPGVPLGEAFWGNEGFDEGSVIVFGYASPEVASVALTTTTGSEVPVEVTSLPGRWGSYSEGPSKMYVAVMPRDGWAGGKLVAYNESGDEIDSAQISEFEPPAELETSLRSFKYTAPEDFRADMDLLRVLGYFGYLQAYRVPVQNWDTPEPADTLDGYGPPRAGVNTSPEATTGNVSIRVLDEGAVVFATRLPDGSVRCIGISGGNIATATFGTQDPDSPEQCRGGWPRVEGTE